MPEPNKKLRLPRLVRARFRHFTLYNLEREIEIDFPDGVFCLAGGNGLGKSTFLLAINYAITGRVPEPDRDFVSLEDYYERTEDFSRSFFDGRISENDRDRAEVEVELRIDQWHLRLRRGMFEPNELNELWLQQEDGKLHQVDGSPAELENQYRNEITSRIGLASFEQLVFLHHFVLTFDERRHLLFWAQRELDQALHLSFGVNAATAKRADILRDKADKALSYGRNASWHASLERNKLKEFEEALSGSSKKASGDVLAKYTQLQNATEQAAARVEKIESSLRDASLKLGELSAKQTTLGSEYDSEFSKRLASLGDIRRHPLIRTSIAAGRCQLCDSTRNGVSSEIEKRVKVQTCPICGGNLSKKPNGQELLRLKELDKQLAAVANDLKGSVHKVERLKVEVGVASDQREAAIEALETFNAEHRKEIARLRAKATPGFEAALEDYRRRIDELEAEKRKRYKEREDYRKKLRPLQQRLEKQYREAENVFVPMFKELAERFLGVDLSVTFELSKTTGARLVVEVNRDERREYHQLSESQRFFVDIALRMALIKYMSAKENPGCLYLDTPEGSLDIAYETRAGQMIARFVQDGFGCVMTANINTSRLLLSLADESDPKDMVLHRMTTWAELSEVQIEEETLFNEAFREIEKRIKVKRKK